MDIFVHIPRTGGQTISQLFVQNYEMKRTIFCGGAYDEVVRLRDATPADMSAAIGHFPINVLNHGAGPRRRVTMLRDPEARHESEYHFHRNTEGSLYPDVSLHQWLDERYVVQPGRLILQNMQVRFVSGAFVWSDCDDMALARAIENLCRMSAFGLQERFEESVLMFGRAFDWQHIFYVPTNKKTPGKPALSMQQADKTPQKLPFLALDRALFAFGQTLFADRVARLGQLFQDALGQYREGLSALAGEYSDYLETTTGYNADRELVAHLRSIPLPPAVERFFGS